MKTETVLQAPSLEDMVGFQRVGSAPKRVIRQMVDDDLPYQNWFFCPVSETHVDLWSKIYFQIHQ